MLARISIAVATLLLVTSLVAQGNRPTTQTLSTLGSVRLIAISVKSLEPSIAWYRDNLGFVLKDRKEFPKLHLRIAMLEHNGFWIEMIEKDPTFSPESIQKQLPTIKDWDAVQGFKKIAFTVTDLDSTVKFLNDRKVKFATDVMGDGKDAIFGRSVIVLDTDGNWIQFCELPKAQ